MNSIRWPILTPPNIIYQHLASPTLARRIRPELRSSGKSRNAQAHLV